MSLTKPSGVPWFLGDVRLDELAGIASAMLQLQQTGTAGTMADVAVAKQEVEAVQEVGRLSAHVVTSIVDGLCQAACLRTALLSHRGGGGGGSCGA